jgi:heme/copper-type cytochrome/quinol oxidase subunit 1
VLGAKLFAIGAVAIALIALVPIKPSDVRFPGFYFSDTYYVVAPTHGILGGALLCAGFAILYYLCDRLFRLRLSHGMSLAHFLLWVFTFAGYAFEAHWLVRAVLTQQGPNQSRLLIAGFVVPMLTFILGGLLFLVNVVRAIVLKLKPI